MRAIIKLLLSATLIACCGTGGSKPSGPILETVKTNYAGQMSSVQDVHGFIDSDHCDATLFSGLLGASGYVTVDLTAAMADSGQWFRRPSQDCLATGDSKSTISRDMFLGIMWWAWRNHRLDVIEGIIQYASDNNLVMGENDGSIDGINRVLMSPTMLLTLHLLRHKLGGADSVAAHTPIVWSYQESGFERHLQVLHFLIRAEARGRNILDLSGRANTLIQKYHEEEPLNVLWSAVHSRYNGVNKSIVTDIVKIMYPKDHLPTNENWCDAWPVQRGPDSSGWKPCDKTKTHSGGELLFAISVLEWKGHDAI
jgi:hypothetical protein